MKKFLILLVVFVAAFLAGYIPKYMEVQQVEQALEATEGRLEADLNRLREMNRVLRLQAQLGMLILEAESTNFGNARERSTKFFDGVSKAISETKDETLRAALEDLLDRRDAVTAALASADPEVVEQLRQLYVRLAKATGVS